MIGSAGSTRVKIGTSVSPEKRLKELQTGNPDRLEVLWYTSGGRELEALLHQAFADHRVEGEWFDFGDVQPVGAIPAAVHQCSGITSRAGRPNARTAPKRPGARPERGEQLVTPERLAAIVRDVVLGVIRPEPKQEEGDDQEQVPVKKRRTVGEDMNRLMAFMYESAATQHARRAVAGKTRLAALGGWPNLVFLAVVTVVAMPFAAFLTLRMITRDIWPVRKLPMLAVVGYWLWNPLGFDKLIRDFVLSRLPVEDIETFARTYFTQAAVTSAYFLTFASLVMCLIGYALQVRDHTEEQRAEAKAKEETKRKTAMPPLLDGAYLAVSPSPLIADLTRPIPQQPSAKNPDRSTTLPHL
ncbi:hypothetical protein T261_0787 [Streptomyces lydicus]|nr:hypothetical protein T261_0787 [Streptomyces lydicus]